MATDLPGGWVAYSGADNHYGAKKSFGNHYKDVLVSDEASLPGVCEALDLEASLQAAGEAAARAQVAADLRAQADALDTPAPAAPAPVEVVAAPDVTVTDSAPADVAAEVPNADTVPDAPAA